MSSIASPSVIVEASLPARGASRLGGIVRSVWTIFQFEFKKSRTWKRMLVWAGVSMFPAFIVFLILSAGDSMPKAAWISVVFLMACEMVVILNALLWVAPILQTELEGKTWLYIVTRPYGRICLVLGKLVNGLTWTLGAGLTALAFVGVVAWIEALPLEAIIGGEAPTAVIMEPEQQVARARDAWKQQLEADPKLRKHADRLLSRVEHGPFPGQPAELVVPEPESEPEESFTSAGEVLRVGGLLAVLAILAGLAYSSLFCGIGCIVPKRAMLLAFSYTLIFETVVAFVPAIINRITIQYHLRCLLNCWIDLGVPLEGQELFFSNWPAWWHLSVLGGMIVLWQAVSLIVVHCRQYIMTDET